jgi:hypothetical protein
VPKNQRASSRGKERRQMSQDARSLWQSTCQPRHVPELGKLPILTKQPLKLVHTHHRLLLLLLLASIPVKPSSRSIRQLLKLLFCFGALGVKAVEECEGAGVEPGRRAGELRGLGQGRVGRGWRSAGGGHSSYTGRILCWLAVGGEVVRPRESGSESMRSFLVLLPFHPPTFLPALHSTRSLLSKCCTFNPPKFAPPPTALRAVCERRKRGRLEGRGRLADGERVAWETRAGLRCVY